MKDYNPSVSPDLFATPSEKNGPTGSYIRKLFRWLRPVVRKIIYEVIDIIVEKVAEKLRENNSEIKTIVENAITERFLDKTEEIITLIKGRIAQLKVEDPKNDVDVCRLYIAAHLFIDEHKIPVYLPEYSCEVFKRVFDVDINSGTYSRNVSNFFKDRGTCSINDDKFRDHIKFFNIFYKIN